MKIGSFSLGFTLGFGTGLVIREALPIAAEIAEPIAKVALRGGVFVFERSREAMMRMGEVIEDIIAEVQSDMKKRREKDLKSKIKKNRTKKALREEKLPIREAA